MNILLFDKVSIYNECKDETIIYGQYKSRITKIDVEKVPFSTVFNNARRDFYIKIKGKIANIETIIFKNETNELKLTNITLYFPFENCDLNLHNKSAIITTQCKNYSHRLDEWIQYNLNLGFSGIVIFNNDENKSNNINEPLENCVFELSLDEICRKYKGKVWLVNQPYSPLKDDHYDNIQRISLHIGVNVFRNKCRNIALIDADEFIYIPKNPRMGIEKFLENYSTITIRSNILTNQNNDDVLNNNILQLAKYVGEDKYTKTILHTDKITENEFINTPHQHRTQQILPKEEIIHYHCWMNNRYTYNNSMPKIDFLHSE